MSKDTELALIKLKNQQQENIKRLDGVIGEASRRYHNNDDVQISLKTLMGAIEVLKDEQKRLIDTQINLSKYMAAQVDEVIEKLNAEKIERLLYSHVSNIEQKSYKLSLACDKKIDEINKNLKKLSSDEFIKDFKKDLKKQLDEFKKSTIESFENELNIKVDTTKNEKN